ncbi:hypothetical protein [Streptomyces sp. NPDC003710]
MNRDEVTAAIVAGKLAKGLTWQQLADGIGRPLVWTTAALLGQPPFPRAAHVRSPSSSTCRRKLCRCSPPFPTAADRPPRYRPIRRSTAFMRRCRSINGPGPGEPARAPTWKKGPLTTRGSRIQRKATGPVVEVLRGRGCRGHFVHSRV